MPVEPAISILKNYAGVILFPADGVNKAGNSVITVIASFVIFATLIGA